MKKLLLVVLAAAFAAAGCATTQGYLPQAHVDSPLLQQFGGQSVVYGQSMSVTNSLDAYCSLAAGAKEVAFLAPGQSAYDVRHWQPFYEQLPIVARCYADEKRQEYLGAAMRILDLSGSGETQAWEITAGQMRWSQNGVAASVSSAPPPAGNPGSIKVRFPRESWNATALLQLVDNVPGGKGFVQIDGEPANRTPLRTGDVFYLATRLVSGWGEQRNLVFKVFDDQDRLVGTYSAWFSVPTYGVQAYQFIVSQYDLRR